VISADLELPSFPAPRRLFPHRFGNMPERVRLLQKFVDQAVAAAADKKPCAPLHDFWGFAAEATDATQSPVYSPVAHSLQRKQCIALGRPTDNAENIISCSTDPNFDLNKTIFKTLQSPIKRHVQSTRLNIAYNWSDTVAQEIDAAYIKIPKPVAPDNGAIFKFMAEECDFGIEHADGSFMDHLHFCHDYSLVHFNEVSPRVLLLHSILGVGTNCFPMTKDKLPALRSLLTTFEMMHIEAFPTILRLLIRGPLLDELDQIVADGAAIDQIAFRRVLDNASLVLSGDNFWTHLNFQLIHALDFLPALAWKATKNSDYFFHIFSRLYAILTRSGKLQARVEFDPEWEREAVKGSRTTDFSHFLLDMLPSATIMKVARKGIEEYSAAIGHDLNYQIIRRA